MENNMVEYQPIQWPYSTDEHRTNIVCVLPRVAKNKMLVLRPSTKKKKTTWKSLHITYSICSIWFVDNLAKAEYLIHFEMQYSLLVRAHPFHVRARAHSIQ